MERHSSTIKVSFCAKYMKVSVHSGSHDGVFRIFTAYAFQAYSLHLSMWSHILQPAVIC